MKKIIQQLLLLSMFCSSALLAKQSSPTEQPTAGPEVHCGLGNKYSIGTLDNPVRATEYTSFLNSTSSCDRPWIESDYYDSSFMTTDQDWFTGVDPTCIHRAGLSGSYQYSVIPGHENDIIDALYWSKIAYEFRDWRKGKEAAAAELLNNPTQEELNNYVNYKIAARLDAAYLDTALEIQNRYPQAAGYVDISLWQQVDDIVDSIYGVDIKTGKIGKKGHLCTFITHYTASDNSLNNFVGRWNLAVSEEATDALGLPSNMPKHFVLMNTAHADERQLWGKLVSVEPPRPWADNYVAGTVYRDISATTKVPYVDKIESL